VREEIDRAAAAMLHGTVIHDQKLLYSVAAVAGMSAQHVRNDIRSRRLTAAQPSRSHHLVDREIVARYAAWLAVGRP